MATTLPVRFYTAPRPSRPLGRWPLASALLFQGAVCGAFWLGVLSLLR